MILETYKYRMVIQKKTVAIYYNDDHSSWSESRDGIIYKFKFKKFMSFTDQDYVLFKLKKNQYIFVDGSIIKITTYAKIVNVIYTEPLDTVELLDSLSNRYNIYAKYVYPNGYPERFIVAMDAIDNGLQLSTLNPTNISESLGLSDDTKVYLYLLHLIYTDVPSIEFKTIDGIRKLAEDYALKHRIKPLIYEVID